MSKPSVFGHISGVGTGTPFASRTEVRAAGLHRHSMNGISGNYAQGADAIAISDGYQDDEDYGDRIIYTGEGGKERGRHTKDQVMEKGNLALVLSEQQGLPVRVIRGAEHKSPFSPASGYRYDGLFMVTRHWSAPSTDGPLIFRYELVKVDESDRSDWAEVSIHAPRVNPPSNDTRKRTSDLPDQPPPGAENPPRDWGTVQRLVRNTKVSTWVKAIHDSACQFCGLRLEVDGLGYAEGAHIKALGSPHNGTDEADNLLCLCPNDHVLFDKGAIYVRDEMLFDTRTGIEIGPVRFNTRHQVKSEYFAYHRRAFAGVA